MPKETEPRSCMSWFYQGIFLVLGKESREESVAFVCEAKYAFPSMTQETKVLLVRSSPRGVVLSLFRSSDFPVAF